MKLKRILEAQGALVKIKEIPIRNYQKRYEIYGLCIKARDALLWASEEERRLIREIGGTLDGQKISFPDDEKMSRFECARQKMAETEIDLPGLPIVLDEEDLENIPLDVSSMMALEDIIEFSPVVNAEKEEKQE